MSLITSGGQPGKNNVKVPSLRISDYLSLDGLGVTYEATGNYSGGGAETFSMGPAAGAVWVIERMMITVAANGAFSANKYGIGAELTNGYDVLVTDTGGTLSTLNGAIPFTTNGGLGSTCYDVINIGGGQGGGASDAIFVRWTFSKAGSAVRLIGNDSGKIEITFNDDLTGLTSHRFFIDGYAEG